MLFSNSQRQAYSLKMSVILLRVRGGLDFSAHIVDEELVEPEVREDVMIIIVIAMIMIFTSLRCVVKM